MTSPLLGDKPFKFNEHSLLRLQHVQVHCVTIPSRNRVF